MITQNKFSRWGGAAFVLGNLLFLVNKLNEMSWRFLKRPMQDVISGEEMGLIIIGQVALIIGYAGLYQVYAPRAGRFAKNALRVMCIGGIVVAVGHLGFVDWNLNLPPELESLFFVVIIGLAAMLFGMIAFGIATLRKPILGRWQWLPLVTGLMGFIGFFIFSDGENTATFLVFRTLFAIGLVGLGVILWLEKSAQAEAVSRKLVEDAPQPS